MNREKLKKFIIAVVCSFSMLMVLGLPVSALSEPNKHAHKNEVAETEEQAIQPRAAMCTACGKGTVTTSVSYSKNPTEEGETAKCIHGKPYGTDKILRRKKTTTYKCSYCGDLSSNITYVYEYECHGYY